MSEPRGRTRGRRVKRIGLLTVAAVLTLASLAYAVLPVGLQNGSFENGLDGWTAQTVRGEAYGFETVPADCIEGDRGGICVVEADEFEVTSDGATFMQRVEPLDGLKMARLGGPFNDEGQDQELERYQLLQSFTVDPANPVIELNYNVSTFDYSGFDELRFTVTLLDGDTGEEIANFVQGAYGSGTDYKNTGWQSAYVDLTGFENRDVELVVDSGGTSDTAYGFWSYIDAGQAPVAPVGDAAFDLPPLPGGGEVDISTYEGGAGQQWLTIPNSQVAQFENGCLGPIDIAVPIDPGAAAISEVQLVFVPLYGGDSVLTPMTESAGVWSASIPCAATGDLFVKYRLEEEGVVQFFTIPIGGITLIDPQGVVYDVDEFNAAKAGGATDEAARAAAAIEDATVRLQREGSGGAFYNVLSGDPGIHPKVNPQITGTNGLYQWDVSAGTYRVVVSADGYETVTSQSVDIPPPVLDLHIPMKSTAVVQPSDRDGDGVPDASDACPDVAASTPDGCPAQEQGGGGQNQGGGGQTPAADSDGDGVTDDKDQCKTVPGNLANGCPSDTAGPKTGPCSSLTGTRLAVCIKEYALRGDCTKRKPSGKYVKSKKQRKLCLKRAKAIAKCEAKSTKKAKKKCVTKAKKVGKKAGKKSKKQKK